LQAKIEKFHKNQEFVGNCQDSSVDFAANIQKVANILALLGGKSVGGWQLLSEELRVKSEELWEGFALTLHQNIPRRHFAQIFSQMLSDDYLYDILYLHNYILDSTTRLCQF
jgi:hypothetical protein